MRTFQQCSIAKWFTALFALTILGGFPHPSSAQLNHWGYWDNGVSESWWFSSSDFTKEDALTAVARWHSIGIDLKDLQNGEWAGDYFRGGETHGTFLRWSTKTGFVMADVDKCQAKVMGLTYGTVRAAPTRFEFNAEFSKTGKRDHSHILASSPKLPMRFVPVKWRGELMLIAENQMSDFGDFIAGLGKYNYYDHLFLYEHEFFFKKERAPANERATATNLNPQVPAGYEHLIKKPITATLTRVGKRLVRANYSYQNPHGTGTSYLDPVSLTYVLVDVGFRDGLKKGMFLRVVEPDEGDTVKLLRVGKFSSKGVIIRDVMDDGSETFFDPETDKPRLQSKIRAGWKLTTAHL